MPVVFSLVPGEVGESTWPVLVQYFPFAGLVLSAVRNAVIKVKAAKYGKAAVTTP